MREGRRRAARAALALSAVAAAAIALALWGAGALAHPEHDSIDLRYQLRPAAPTDEVVVVAVDGRTFADLGRPWPFPRSLYGRAARRLHAAGAREIVFDIQFTEPTEEREDLALYDGIARAGGAVLATSESDERGRTNVLGGDENLEVIGARAAASNVSDGEAGMIRSFPYAVGRLETIAVAVAARAGRPLARDAFPAEGALIDYRGGPGTIPTLSFSSLLAGRFDPALVRGKVVVIGASAPTLQDVHPTPVGGRSLMSGPEIQANAIWTALHGLPLRHAPRWLDALAIVLLSLAVPLVARGRRVLTAALALAPLLALLYLAIAYAAFDAGVVLAVTYPLLGLTLASVGGVAASHVFETGERRRVARENGVLEQRVLERTAELEAAQLELVARLGRAVESRDEDTGQHIERISDLCHRLGVAAGLGPEEAQRLRHASVLHDLGKLSLPDGILLKPGPLEAEERLRVQAHTTAGAAILAGSRSPVVQMAETIARTHHERWDGSGYPAGLAGEAIPLVGRITGLCDVFDALVSVRPYKPAWSVADALEEIRRGSGRHFDPRLVPLFVELVEQGEPGFVAGFDTRGQPGRSASVVSTAS